MDVLFSPENNAGDNAGVNNHRHITSIAETVINGFFTVDDHWIVTAWNKAAELLLGVHAKNIIGRNIWEVFKTVIPPATASTYQNASLQKVPFHFHEYWSEMGRWFDVITYYDSDTLSVSFKSSNHLPPVHPKSKLKILNELYRFVTEITSDCLWEWNIRKQELFWIDGGHQRVFGYNIVNTIVAQKFWENCLHPEDKVRVTDRLYSIFTTGTAHIWEDEYRFKKSDGTYAYVHDRGQIIYEHGKPARMIGATQDITARKLMELKLFESERTLSLIARQTVNAVIITDARENILWVNAAFTRITGYSEQEVIGRKPGSFLQGIETNPLTIDYLRNKMKKLEGFDCEIINYAKSGKKYWIHLQGQPILDGNGNCDRFFAIETDISERKLFEAKLLIDKIAKQQELTEAVLIAQEHERADIGQELHDNVNQILGATKLYIEMARGTENNKEVYLDEASGHLMESIEEIRKISKRLIPPGLSLIGLHDSIQILVDDLSRVHPIQITFSGDKSDSVAIDEKMQLNIFRIVQEQVNNILKHSAASEALITLEKNNNELFLTISDNGKGCDMNGQKNGVGIRNILSRVELYKGSLSTESKPGEGYVLKVTLPVESKP